MNSAMAMAAKRAQTALVLALGLFVAGGAQPALAAKIKNPVAVFSGLDKITGRTTSFDVYIDETVQFGALQVTPKVCYSRDAAEPQKISGFVEVDEITLDRKIRRIFTGWMFAASPGLNAVDHPIYDVWLTDCKQSSDVPAPAETKAMQNDMKQPAAATEVKPEASTDPAAEAQPEAGTDALPALDPNVDIGVEPQQ